MPDETETLTKEQRLQRTSALLEGIREQVDGGPALEGLLAILAKALRSQDDGKTDIFEAASIGVDVFALALKVRLRKRS